MTTVGFWQIPETNNQENEGDMIHENHQIKRSKELHVKLSISTFLKQTKSIRATLWSPDTILPTLVSTGHIQKQSDSTKLVCYHIDGPTHTRRYTKNIYRYDYIYSLITWLLVTQAINVSDLILTYIINKICYYLSLYLDILR